MAEEEHSQDDSLPFEVEVERLPMWSHVAAGIVVAIGVGVALHLIPMIAFLPFLVASSLGRRFASSAMHVEVHDDGLSLGERREVAKADIVDVWLDEEEPRVVVAIQSSRIEIVVLYFPNQEQARRFSDELGARTSRSMVVAGHAPRWIDALSSLRFVAIAAAFVGTGSWIGASALLFFAIGAYPFVRAKQIVVKDEGRTFEARTAFGTKAHPRSEAEDVIAVGSIRDLALGAPAWTTRARARVLAQLGAK